MKKPARSSTKSEKVLGPGLGVRFDTLLPSPETWEHMRNCEARHWLKRYRETASASGGAQARLWWQQVCADIEKRRGAEALADLRRRMNEQRKVTDK